MIRQKKKKKIVDSEPLASSFTQTLKPALMPPIRRERSKKVGLRRIDAAYDALVPLGFSKDIVRRTISKLLKVYGGENGWVVVEEASYKMVIETILDEQERERTVCEEGTTNGQGREATDDQADTINGRGMESPIVNDGDEEETETREEQEKAERSMRDQNVGEQFVEIGQTSSRNDAVPRMEDRPRPRRPPCYGWLSEEED
ncbi:uncharacterized protein LOC103720748 [Phoenix dactylifera]|uniref:Uncharacterized protein LOC103720748 n=1 Tax=Phoenix dactylifera TaxID=42345 RepID=A0A8B8ZHS2_PHODC|nr:uncharacterized protein LOC103720748 [Phoenix dactylifera]